MNVELTYRGVKYVKSVKSESGVKTASKIEYCLDLEVAEATKKPRSRLAAGT